MANFNFARMTFDINSDDIVSQFINYGPLKNLNVTSHSATEFRLQANVTTVVYVGTDFKFKGNGDPKSGTINEINTYIPHHANDTFNITGLSLKIGDMQKAFASTTNPLDDLALVAKIFGGADTFTGGRANDTFYGLGGSDTMSGIKGNDKLDGGKGNDVLAGGLGLDTLTGGAGKDSFIFDTGPKMTNDTDTITDFNPVDDTIKLEDRVLYKIGGPGHLDPNKFFSVDGPPAIHKEGAIMYDQTNGDLYWSFGSLMKQLAHLDGAPTLTSLDIEII